jgi:hypothetical protein
MQKKLIQHQQLYHDFQAASSLKCQAIIAGHCCLEIARTKKRCENLDGCKAGMVETRATSEPCKHPIAVLSNAVYSPDWDGGQNCAHRHHWQFHLFQKPQPHPHAPLPISEHTSATNETFKCIFKHVQNLFIVEGTFKHVDLFAKLASIS